MKKVEQIVILGLGRFGMACVKYLSKYDCDVLAIDEDEALVEEAVDYATRAVQVNATDTEILNELGISNFDIAIIGIGEDIEASLMIALTLKELGVKKIIAKARNEKHAKLLEMIGVEKIVQPEIDSAFRLINSITTKYIKEKVELGKDYSLVEIETPNEWQGNSFSNLALRQKYSINVVCVRRNEEVIFPVPSTILENGDTLLIMASKKTMELLDKLF